MPETYVGASYNDTDISSVFHITKHDEDDVQTEKHPSAEIDPLSRKMKDDPLQAVEVIAMDPEDTRIEKESNFPQTDLCRRNRNTKRKSRRPYAQNVLMLFSALYTFLFAGGLWGWGPMQLMLEENGSFHYLCDDEQNDIVNNEMGNNVCPRQTARLLTVQMTGQLTILLSPVLGAIADQCGSTVLMNLLGGSGIMGVVFLLLAAQTGLDWFLFPAFICLGLMAVGSSVMTVLTGLVFQGRSRTRVISGLNALYDAGSITYLGLWKIKEWGDFSLTTIAASYLVAASVTFGGAVYAWKMVDSIEADSAMNENISSDAEYMRGNCRQSVQISADNNEQVIESESLRGEGYQPIATRPTHQQLCSKLFIALAIFFSFYQSRSVFTLTTARDFLGNLGDDEADNLYLSVFSLLLPASILVLPFVDIVLRKFGYGVGLQMINLLALLHGLVQVISKSLKVQILGFVAFTFFRCFLFAVVFSFMASFLSPNATGTGAGFLNLAGGIGMFSNIFLANTTILKYGSFFIPNMLYTAPIVPMVAAAFLMGEWARRNREEDCDTDGDGG